MEIVFDQRLEVADAVGDLDHGMMRWYLGKDSIFFGWGEGRPKGGPGIWRFRAGGVFLPSGVACRIPTHQSSSAWVISTN
jgi:hypothetical protein